MSNTDQATAPKLFDAAHRLLENPKATQSVVTATEAMARFRIAGDVLAKATADLPDHEREAIKWLGGWVHENKLNLKDLVGRLKKKNGLDYSFHSIYSVMSGRRTDAGVGVAEFCEAIERYRRQIAEVQPAASTGFIQTELTRKIFRVCRRAYEKRRMTFIFGDYQIGKTTAVAEYQRLNPTQVVLVRMPTQGYIGEFLDELATRVYVPTQQHALGSLKRRIMDCFDEHTLLIVDECHQCFTGISSSRGAYTLDWIRELHDRRKCGVVMCGNLDFRDGLVKGPDAKRLRGLWLRRFSPLQLPDKPSVGVLDDFARAFGLPTAPDRQYQVGNDDHAFRKSPAALQQEVIERDGLGLWTKLLEEARDLAECDKARMQWRYVIEAYAQQVAFEQVKTN